MLDIAPALASCGNVGSDSLAGPPGNALGPGLRLRDIGDPANKKAGATVLVTGAVVTAVDTFDETGNGKSRGTIFVQDYGSHEPYSGLSLFSPKFVPANLRVFTGDVLDLDGAYVEAANIGTKVFAIGPLPQLSQPKASFRYEAPIPEATVIDVVELVAPDANGYAKARKWLNMIVTINNVTLSSAGTNDGAGRVSAPLILAANGPKVTNELFPLKEASLPKGAKFKSITGIVTFFDAFNVAPRSQDDLVPAQ